MIRSGLLTGLTVVVVLGCSSWVFGAKNVGKGIQEEIEKEQIHLERLEKKLGERKEKAKKVERKKGSVLKTIEDLDRHLVQRQRSYQKLQKQFRKIDHEIADLNSQLSQLELKLREQASSVAARLRRLYREGRGSYLKALLSADTFGGFQRRLDYLSAITKHEYRILEQFREDREDLVRLQNRREQARGELLIGKGKAEKKIAEIKHVKQKKRTLLTSLTKEKELHKHAVAELQRSAQQVDALVKELMQRLKLSQSRAKKPLNRIPTQGSLLWPVEGKVVTFFGRQKHPDFDTFITKKGIEINTSEGSSIKSVSTGKVVYADWLKGYGLMIIVDHANGLFSLYAHASKLLVKEGETVQVGQVIGEAGETGLTRNSTLYFELRKGVKPVDPLKWLVKRP